MKIHKLHDQKYIVSGLKISLIYPRLSLDLLFCSFDIAFSRLFIVNSGLIFRFASFIFRLKILFFLFLSSSKSGRTGRFLNLCLYSFSIKIFRFLAMRDMIFECACDYRLIGCFWEVKNMAKC